EWINSFIDGGRMPSLNDKPVRSNIVKETSSQLIFEAGQGRLYVLLNLVKPADRELDIEIYQLLQSMLNILAAKHPVVQQDNYYLVNISTGECTCLDFMWNGSFRDVCKHVHAAHLFNDIENNKIIPDIIKHDLMLYFHNKERAMPNEQKNYTIYNNSDDVAFEEILRIYSEQGNDIFFFCEHGVTEKDPFHPVEMPARKTLGIGAPKIHGAKPRKLNSFAPTINKENFPTDNVSMLLDNEVELSNVSKPKETSIVNTREELHSLAPSIQKQLTTAIHNRKHSISKKLIQSEGSVNTKSSKKAITRSALKDLFAKKQIG
ncbi:5419_t:CDS:2, partial [Cetraspora pellucida]